MSKDSSRASILSSKLDFESIDGSEPPKTDYVALNAELGIDATASSSVAKPSMNARSSSPPAYSPQRPALERKSSKKTTSKEELGGDRFAVYAAIIVLFGFAILLAIFFYIRSVNSNAAGLSYYTLPQQVVNLNGQVIRMQVTVQVRSEDQEWLFENKKLLADIFQIEIGKVDPDDLHSEEGFDTVRAQFKSGLNQALKTDRIESVLINELLIQNRE